MRAAQLAQGAFILAAAAAVYTFVHAARNDHELSSCSALCALRPAYAGQNRTVPTFSLKNYQGKMVRFDSLLQGKPVVLNFWTKTCKPCLEEMPSLANLAQIVGKDGVRVVTVCTDEGPEAVRETLQVVLNGQEPPFEILFDPDHEVVGDMFGTSLFPETWVIDRRGVIRARIDGQRDWTSPLALELIEKVGRPGGCPVAFERGKATGPHSGLCGDELL